MVKPFILTIRLYGDPCLREKSIPVKEIGPGERVLINAMVETMYAVNGIGLSACQVGINQRFFVADAGNGLTVFVNPDLIKRSGEDVFEEGCLSIPEVVIPVKRAKNIRVRYVDLNNKSVERNFSGLLAKVIQHETDHLDGKMIVDYASPKKKKEYAKILENLEKESQR